MKKFSRHLLILLAVIVTTNYSQNINDALRLSFPGIGANAKALGMGNAYNALSYDYSGSFFNPAGLGTATRAEFSGSFLYNSFENSTEFFDSKTDFSNSTTNLSQAGLVLPMPTVQGSLVFGFGFNQSKNFNSAMEFNGFNSGNTSMIQSLLGFGDISYELYLTDTTGTQTPINGKLNQSGDIIEEGKINNWALAGAIEVAKDVFFGASLNIISGNYKSDRRYYEDDTKNIYDASVRTDPSEAFTADFQTFYLNDVIDWDISGWDFKIGFLYKLPNFMKIGATVKFPTKYTIKENYFVEATSEFGDGTIVEIDPIRNIVEYDITSPYEFTGAFAYELADLTLSAEATFIDYTQMKFGDGLDQGLVSSNNRDIKDAFKEVINYNFGFEYRLPEPFISIRGGFIMQPSAFKNDPSEFNRKYITAGLGIMPNKVLSLDLAYAYGWWNNIGDNYGFNDSRTYQDITSTNVILTARYLF